MRGILGFAFVLVAGAFVLAGILTLLWWLFIVAAVTAVAGIVWRTVTQR